MTAWDLVAQVRGEVPDTPLILMTYYNPILSYAWSGSASGWPSAG